MPRILPTFAAIAIIGVCIAFNTVRYPIVWEMVGPNTSLSLSEKCAPAAEDAAAKVAASEISTPNSPPPADGSQAAEITVEKKIPPIQAELPAIAKDVEKSALPKAVPISVPKEEMAAAAVKKDAAQVEKAENDRAAADENLVEPPRRLVPVANDAASAGSPRNVLDEVRRLPPLEAEIAVPADRYAAEYSDAAIPIYPSTGR